MILHVAVQVEKWVFLLHRTECRLSRRGYVGDDRGIRFLFPPHTYNCRSMTPTIHSYSVGWSRMRDAIPPLLHYSTCLHEMMFNRLTPNDPYSGRTAPLTSKRFILYIYSTNIGTEYFKHGIYSPFLSLQNAVCFIILTYLVPSLFTFYIQSVLKFKKIIPAPKC